MKTPFDRAPCLSGLDTIAHGFFGRRGGVSEGLYASLNTGFGSDDDKTHVAENRARVADALDVAPDGLITAYQTHSPNVVVVTEPWAPGDAPEADAMVTTTPGIALGVLAADCIPVLFADRQAGVIGAAHAGWRGALAGVLEATVAEMEKAGAARHGIRAAIGPCLRQINFEVGFDLIDQFMAKYPSSEKFFAPGVNDEKRQLDLTGFAAWRLKEAGVETVDDIGRCTLGEKDAFFSYRASRKAEEPDFGRNISAIALKGE